MSDKNDLLEYLHEQVGCEYLSDLKVNTYHRSLRSAIKTTNYEDFSKQQWEEAMYYILDVKREYASKEEILEALK